MAAMDNDEFERFVLKFGKDILRFCRMIAKDAENGDELYQDTMLKLLEKKKKLEYKELRFIHFHLSLEE